MSISDIFDNIKLSPCPFCGGTNLACGTDYEVDFDEDLCDEYDFDDENYAVRCDARAGGCGATSGYYSTKIEAITNWNRRAR